MQNLTIESMSERTVGHDDMAWGLMDEMALASLLTDPKTKDLFKKDTNSLECRSLFLKKFGSKFSVEQCQKKVDIYSHTHTHTHTHARTRAYTYTYTYIYIHIHIFICIYLSVVLKYVC